MRGFKAIVVVGLAAVVLAAGVPAMASISISFDDTNDTDDWSIDRYAPAVFDSGVAGGGRTGVLQHGVRKEDNQSQRSQSDAFYNYQGMQYAVGISGPASTSIEIYVDSAWQTGARAGIWAVMDNGNKTYPIIEYVVGAENDFSGFRWWQSYVGWTNGFAVAEDDWHQLEIVLGSQYIDFFVNGQSLGQVDKLDAESLSAVILNVHNQGEAGEYDVYWDNFTASAIPEPTSIVIWSLIAVGFLGVASRRRRRKAA